LNNMSDTKSKLYSRNDADTTSDELIEIPPHAEGETGIESGRVVVDDKYENKDRNISSKTLEENDEFVKFTHIYNGIIFTENEYHPMIEFKVTPVDEGNTSLNPVFSRVQFKCGWFIISTDEHSVQSLRGPVKIDLEKIKDGVRLIADDEFPEINGCEIECVSNEQESLIHVNDTPMWMLNALQKSL
ncbi:hypothetical protein YASMINEVIRUS_1459, partial [Yasminevirus sp. GU-2018]